MIKAILFDIDGVVLPKKLFSQRFAQDYGLELEDVTEFFHNEFKQCLIGQADLSEELLPYLERWGWEGSSDDFLDYWFSNDEADLEVVKIVQKLKEFGVDCHLVSNQEKYRAEYLLKDLDLGNIFDEAFFSWDLETIKSDPTFFKKVLAGINLKPHEVLLIDDEIKNLDAAASVGINTHLYTKLADLKDATKNLISN